MHKWLKYTTHNQPSLMYQENYFCFFSKTLDTFYPPTAFSSPSSHMLLENVVHKFLSTSWNAW